MQKKNLKKFNDFFRNLHKFDKNTNTEHVMLYKKDIIELKKIFNKRIKTSNEWGNKIF